MKKIQLLFILPFIMALLAFADYLVTRPDLGLPDSSGVNPAANEEGAGVISQDATLPAPPNLTKTTLDDHPELNSFVLEKTTRSSDLFETLDVSQMKVSVYKNSLLDAVEKNPSVVIYELHASAGQGGFTFLNLKLALTNQLSAQSEINENNQYGQASLFYNNASDPSTGFLLVQINDTIFGFKYPKKSQPAFEFIQKFIQVLSPTAS